MAAPTSTTGSTDHRAVPDREGRRWLGIHAFYADDQDPLLVDCVSPLVRSLRARRLVDRYFFIRYWQEGPHVRLRLRPAPGVPAEVVATEAERALADYLLRRPAADPPRDLSPDGYRRMFLAEYDQPAWDRLYGPDGHMPVRANNSVRRVDYEPEYPRYGGPAGVELAEWHFETSSDLVLRLLAGRRPGRPALLGLSAQLGLILCLAFLDGGQGDRLTGFLARYRDFWTDTYGPADADLRRVFQQAYAPMAERLRRRAAKIRAAVAAGADPGHEPGPATRSGWLAHCLLLRRRAADLAAAGEIQFEADRPVLAQLLHSYLHMTNNRLGVAVVEEAYIAHLLRLALTDEDAG